MDKYTLKETIRQLENDKNINNEKIHLLKQTIKKQRERHVKESSDLHVRIRDALKETSRTRDRFNIVQQQLQEKVKDLFIEQMELIKLIRL